VPPIDFDACTERRAVEYHSLARGEARESGVLDLCEALPRDVLSKVLVVLGVESFSALPSVSSSWKRMSQCDMPWREFYREKFSANFSEAAASAAARAKSPSSSSQAQAETLELSFATRTSAREVAPTAPLSPRPRVVVRRLRSGSHGGEAASPTSSTASSPRKSPRGGRRSPPASPSSSITSPRGSRSWKERYRRRFESPIVGDAVEVSWHGKFRLESCEVHAGCAWWAAHVVDKLKLHDETGDQWWYKVTFPGWQGRWDEWVPLERLRWPVKRSDPKFERCIRPRDSVEVWCSSKNVPGAWLEAKVIKVRANKYLIGRAQTLAGDPIWVQRDRLRLSPKEERRRLALLQKNAKKPILSKMGFCSPRPRANDLLSSNPAAAGPMPSFVGRGYVDADGAGDDDDDDAFDDM